MSSRKIKLLLLEDSELDAELTMREINDMDLSFETKLVSEKEEYENSVLNWEPDLIISDFNLVTFKGDEALSFAKKVAPEVPFITLSATIDKAMEVTLLKERANDVLNKSSIKRLPFAIHRVLNERQDKERLNNAFEELKKSNTKLTKLLAEKEVLVGEVHHRVKNNLALISSFLQLEQLGVIESANSEQLLSANILRIRSIGAVHEIAYRQGSFSEIDILDLLESILIEAFSEVKGGSKEMKKTIPERPIKVNINVAVPFALLISELFFQVTHMEGKLSYSPTRELEVTADQSGENIRVSFRQKELTRILSYLKKELEVKFTEIIEVLAKQLNAELTVNDEEGVTYLTFENKKVKGSSSSI